MCVGRQRPSAHIVTPECEMTPTTKRSPMQRAVAELIDRTDLVPPGCRVVVDHSTRQTLGDVRVRLQGPAGEDHPELLPGIAKALLGSDGVGGATVIPPRIYIKLDAGFIQQVVSAGVAPPRDQASDGAAGRVIVSFSDPNLNKPLHVGHLRNNFIGMAICRMFEESGYRVECQADHNDWGLPLCQTAVAYQLWGRGETPESSNSKPDHFIGGYYVKFHQAAHDGDPLRISLDEQAAAMLASVERGEASALDACRRVCSWAEAGIRATYRRIGSRLDRILYGSQFVEAGNELFRDGVATGQLAQRADGSVYADLEGDKLGEVTLVRRDGTPLFYRQWLAMDIGRFGDGRYHRAVIVNGREWRPAFSMYSAILRQLGHEWVDKVEPIYYGMVNLASGKMSSRRGQTVTADDLIDIAAERLAVQTPNAVTAERMAIALLAWYLLKYDRESDIEYNDDALWNESLPELMRCAHLLTFIATDGEAIDSQHRSVPSSRIRDLLIEMDRFDITAATALAALEPAKIVRYAKRIVSNVGPLTDRQVPPREVLVAAAHTVGKSLQLLNIDLPPLAIDDVRGL
jgi:arginyl-tRNA synthetase